MIKRNTKSVIALLIVALVLLFSANRFLFPHLSSSTSHARQSLSQNENAVVNPDETSATRRSTSEKRHAHQKIRTPSLDNPVGVPHGVPDGVPEITSYSHLLNRESLLQLEKFLLQHPNCDLTDHEQFHQLLSEQREKLPHVLDDATSAQHNRWLIDIENLQQDLVAARAKFTKNPLSGTTTNGSDFTLTSFEGTTPRHSFSTNAAAAETTAADLVRLNSTYLNASGSGLYVNINDNQAIKEHTEFQLPNAAGSRIILNEIATTTTNHSTHITGTVTAWGYTYALMGMAPRAWIRGHNNSAITDITAFGARWPGQPLDGTSTNPRDGSLQQRSVVGVAPLGGSSTNNCVYTNTCLNYDRALYDTPYFSQFFSSNNLGNTTTANYLSLGIDHPVAKNIIVIGSIGDMVRDATGNFTSGGTLSDFSSRGPTFDGRIKPDFTCNGHLISSTSGTNSAENMSGTSQASANAAGTALLVIDYINRVFPGHFFRSPTVKAILATTATGLGNPGPDYHYGWGAMNAKAACDLIKGYADAPAKRTIVEDELSQAQTWSRSYNNPGAGSVRITMAWLDPAGASQQSSTTDRSSRLVNDLNLRLISSNGTIYRPWVMPYTTGNESLPAFDVGLFSANAVAGNNTTDNIEQVFVSSLPAGNYTVEVSHAGSLRGTQPFSLVFQRMTAVTAPAPAVSSVAFPTASPATNGLTITAEGTGFTLGANMFLRRTSSTGTQQQIQGYGVMIVGNRISARFDAANLTPGYWDVAVVNPGGVESILQNGYLIYLPGGSPRRFTLYANHFENGASGLNFHPQLTGWTLAEPNKGAVGGPSTAQQGSHALVTHAGGNYPANAYSSVYLPHISTVGYTDIRLECQRWLGVASVDEAEIRYYPTPEGLGYTLVKHTNLMDTGWSAQNYDFHARAAGNSSLSIEFTLYADQTTHSFGWNIDDLKVTGVASYALPPLFASTTLGTAAQNLPFSATVTASDEDTASASLTFAATGLPPGLSLSTNGTITGTPTSLGTTSFTVSVTDGIYTSSKNFSITTVSPIAKWRIDNGLPSDGTGIGANTADVDNDALANLLEYAFGSDPATPTRVLAYTAGGAVVTAGKPILASFGDSDAEYRAVFLRRKDHLISGLNYTVQFSADLNVWVNSTTSPTVLTGTSTANPSQVEAVSVPIPLSIAVPNGFKQPTFFRVVVSPP